MFRLADFPHRATELKAASFCFLEHPSKKNQSEVDCQGILSKNRDCEHKIWHTKNKDKWQQLILRKKLDTNFPIYLPTLIKDLKNDHTKKNSIYLENLVETLGDSLIYLKILWGMWIVSELISLVVQLFQIDWLFWSTIFCHKKPKRPYEIKNSIENQRW